LLMTDDSLMVNVYAKKGRFSPEGNAAGNESSRASMMDGLTWIGGSHRFAAMIERARQTSTYYPLSS
jgi:hypothetical protein